MVERRKLKKELGKEKAGNRSVGERKKGESRQERLLEADRSDILEQ